MASVDALVMQMSPTLSRVCLTFMTRPRSSVALYGASTGSQSCKTLLATINGRTLSLASAASDLAASQVVARPTKPPPKLSVPMIGTRFTDRHEVLVKTIHLLHIRVLDVEPFHLSILKDTTLGDALWKRHVSMLQRPPYEKLSWRARVLFGKASDGGMSHPQGSNKWGIRLHSDSLLFAVVADLGPGVERVHLRPLAFCSKFRNDMSKVVTRYGNAGTNTK